MFGRFLIIYYHSLGLCTIFGASIDNFFKKPSVFTTKESEQYGDLFLKNQCYNV